MSISYSRASRIASSSPKEFDFQYFIFQNEGFYPMWITADRILGLVYSLPESVVWNSLICFLALISLIITSMDLEVEWDFIGVDLMIWVDVLYNILFALNSGANLYYDCYRIKHQEVTFQCTSVLFYALDGLSFLHYVTIFIPQQEYNYIINIICYYIRLHRPLTFLRGLMDYNMRGDILGMLLKYFYMFIVIRVLYVNFFMWIRMVNFTNAHYKDPPLWLARSNRTRNFFKGYYVVNKLFLAMGPDVAPKSIAERLAAMSLMVSGCLIVAGLTVASMSLIVGIFMRPEEIFRARFRIILEDMKNTHVPEPLRQKVETFYRMYWHKQKAVSTTYLIPLFPPTLKNAINTDIYFEGQQKSRILCDLSYQFLAEIAKFMQTIHYVPGDTVIQRKSTKSTMVYISYGDVEMLTAEDDDTPILRFTRGSIMNPCGGCAEVASAVSHVSIRAATFCSAHVLEARDLWQVTAKFGKTSGQAFILHSAFEEHFEKVKRHYSTRTHQPAKYKSTILLLKRNLIELKQARGIDGKLLLDRYDMFLEIAGCYVMRNQHDKALRDDSDAVCLRPTFPYILQPRSSLLIAWNIAVAILTVIVAFTHPYQFMYLKTISLSFKFFDFFVTIIYLLDIVVYLSTGTNVEEGVPVTFGETASRQYASFWFAVDLVSVLPILVFVGDGRFAGLNKIVKMLKVFRLLKTYEDVFIHNSNQLRFLAYVLVMICLIYILAAAQQFFFCFESHACKVKNISTPPYWYKSELDDGPATQRLVYSWFWSISLMTFTTHKTQTSMKMIYTDQLMVMVIMELLILTHIMIEAIFSATIMVTTHMRDQYNTCIETVTSFLKKSNVDPVLRHRFTDYLKLCWFTDKAYSITHNKDSILFDLPPHVYEEIMAMQRNKYLLCIPGMKLLNKAVLKKLCAHSRVFYTSPNEILQNSGEISNEIYVIRQGICEVLNPITRQVSSILSQKSHFGDIECILRLPAFYTVRAVTHVQMFSISRKHLVKAISIPSIVASIRYARQQPEYMQLQTRYSSFLKYEIAPHPPNRVFFPLPRKHEPDTAFLLPFTRLGFFAILRYIFPRFAIRPDGRYLKRYEWFRSACAITSALMFPVYNILKLQWHWIYYLGWFLDVSAYVDILQRMLVAYFNEKGILIYHPASTAAHYIKGAFIMDLISCAPLEAFDSVRTVIYAEEDGYRIPSTGQYFMYNRLGQLYRVRNALDILNDYIGRQDIIFLIKALPIFLALLSVMTSFMLESTFDIYDLYEGGYKITIKDDHSWARQYKDFVGFNITASSLNTILACFYWVTYEVTTVGFDKVQPSTMEQLYALILSMLTGTMLTTFVAVTVLSIRANVNQALASFQGHIKDLKIFMIRENLDVELQKEVLSHYAYKWEKTCGIDYRTMLKLCDQITLRTDAILHIYGQTFSKCPLLYRCDVSLCRILGRAVYSLYSKEHMMLVERDEVISDLFIVDYGTVEIRHPNDDNHAITKLPRGSMFGNLDNVQYKLSPNRFVASANVHLLKIDSVTFYKIIADFPSVKVLLLKFRPNMENYIIGSLRDQSVVASTWRERAMSSPLIVVSKEGFMKFFNVQSKVMQMYFIVVALCSVYGEIFNAGFQDNSLICIIILYVLDILFFLKILFYFLQPFISDEESESRTALVSSRKNYLYGEFKYDILSMLPLELFGYLEDDFWSLYPYLRLNRTLRIATVYNGLGRYHLKLSINLTVATISSFIVWFTFFIHVSSCIWYHLSIVEEHTKTHSSWRFKHTCEFHSGGISCHFERMCNEGNDYLCSVYFILSTFTQNGVGDILPRQQKEVVFVCALMICSTMLMMIYVGEFSNILQYQSFRCFHFYSKYLQLQNFLTANRVSRNLVEMTKLYTLYLWRESRGYQLPHFLETAPQCLRLRVMSAAYLDHLNSHPTFQYCEPAFLRHLAGCLQPFLYVENMWVVKEAEITNAMYFVHRGRVKELDEEMEREMMVYEPGTFFGTPHGLVRDLPYELSYKTVIKSQILTLTFTDWEFLLEHFTKSREAIYKIVKKDDEDREEKKKKKIQITKAPTVRTIARKSEVAAEEARARTGIPSGRDSGSDSAEQSDKEPESPWPMHSREDEESEKKTGEKKTKSFAFSGIPSGRDSDTPDNKTESPWPLHSRDGEKKPETDGKDALNQYPKIRERSFSRKSTDIQQLEEPKKTGEVKPPAHLEEKKRVDKEPESTRRSLSSDKDRQTEDRRHSDKKHDDVTKPHPSSDKGRKPDDKKHTSKNEEGIAKDPLSTVKDRKPEEHRRSSKNLDELPKGRVSTDKDRKPDEKVHTTKKSDDIPKERRPEEKSPKRPEDVSKGRPSSDKGRKPDEKIHSASPDKERKAEEKKHAPKKLDDISKDRDRKAEEGKHSSKKISDKDPRDDHKSDNKKQSSRKLDDVPKTSDRSEKDRRADEGKRSPKSEKDRKPDEKVQGSRKIDDIPKEPMSLDKERKAEERKNTSKKLDDVPKDKDHKPEERRHSAKKSPHDDSNEPLISDKDQKTDDKSKTTGKDSSRGKKPESKTEKLKHTHAAPKEGLHLFAAKSLDKFESHLMLPSKPYSKQDNLSEVNLTTPQLLHEEVMKYRDELALIKKDAENLNNKNEQKEPHRSSANEPKKTAPEEDKPSTSRDISKKISDESEEEEPPKPSYGRRKSTFHNVDIAATNKELQSIRLSEDVTTQTPPFRYDTKSTSTGNASLPLQKRSSAEELELRNILYSQNTSQKTSGDINNEGQVILPPGLTQTQLNFDNEEATLEIPIANSDQTLKLKVRVSGSITPNPDRVSADMPKTVTKSLAPDNLPSDAKPSRSLANMEPELFLNLGDLEAKDKRSVLSFKDEITTVEIPISTRSSVNEIGPLSNEDILEKIEMSMTAFIDDLAMKEKAAAVIPPPMEKPSTSAGGVRYASYEDVFHIGGRKLSKERDSSTENLLTPLKQPSSTSIQSSTSIVSLGSAGSKSAPSTMDVEDFMIRQKQKKKDDKKKYRKDGSEKSSSDVGRHGRRKRKKESSSSDEDYETDRLAQNKNRRHHKWPWL